MDRFLKYLELRSDYFIDLTFAHARVVVISLLIASFISIALGVATYRRPKWANAVLAVCGTFLTIPSFALLALLITVLGLGQTPTIIALVTYALLPIVRNTITGLRSVDPAVVESARGMGMSKTRRLLRIELPLAWPVILTGLRVATVMMIGIAAIAAAVNGPGLGEPIFTGLSRQGSAVAENLVLGGTLGVIVLALIADALFVLVGRFTTSKGIR
jgi:osmoprotectant transport system permease protein